MFYYFHRFSYLFFIISDKPRFSSRLKHRLPDRTDRHQAELPSWHPRLLPQPPLERRTQREELWENSGQKNF